MSMQVRISCVERRDAYMPELRWEGNTHTMQQEQVFPRDHPVQIHLFFLLHTPICLCQQNIFSDIPCHHAISE